MVVNDLISSLSDNQYFSAGFGLVGVGALLSGLRRSTIYFDQFLRKYCLTVLEIPSKDKSYEWVMSLLSKKNVFKNKHNTVETTFNQLDTGKIVTEFEFPPSTGIHYMFYKGYPIKVDRVRDSRLVDVTRGGAPFETITMTTVGRDNGIFINLLEEARKLAIEKSEGKTVTYICSGSEWVPFGFSRKRRPLHSVILEEGLSEKMYADVREFLTSSKWYIDRGIPYRRGYLLYGPPGCGKTSFITAIAGELYYNICVLNLAERGLSDDRLHYLLNTAPQQSIIVLEDIDSPFNRSTNDAYMVSHSGLLNALDGVASSEERIIFMTTNHIDRLDPALIRPGRVDLVQRIGHLNQSQISRMYQRFYPDQLFESSQDFADKVINLNLNLSPAQLQAYLLLHKNCPLTAMEKVDDLFSSH